MARSRAIVEKPSPEVAPSNLAVVGRYVLSGSIFDLLEQTTPGDGGEIQLTDGIAALMQHERVLAYRFEGRASTAAAASAWSRRRSSTRWTMKTSPTPPASTCATPCRAEPRHLACLPR